MPRLQPQDETPSPEFSKQDAENLVQVAAANYVKEQSKKNREALLEAEWALVPFEPPMSEWGISPWPPSRLFVLSLMPEHLKSHFLPLYQDLDRCTLF